jgi:hypothetical protein
MGVAAEFHRDRARQKYDIGFGTKHLVTTPARSAGL